MEAGKIDIKEMHWYINLLQAIDVGLVVIDREYNVQIWNSFMENHSNMRPDAVVGKNLFDLFSDISPDWFKRKSDSVFQLNSRAFTNWEQRPYLFRFKNYRPITGVAEFMYQNITFVPLMSLDGQVGHLGLIIYDVTDIAIGKIEIEKANTQLEVLSRTDRLTNINNRGYLEENLAREFDRSKRTFQSCSLVMFDIDHFKNVNDTFGHQAGDLILVETANLLKSTIRTTDIPGRYGGEEFCTILIDANAKEAMLLAERLRKKIEALVTIHNDNHISCTISLGIAEVTEDMENYKRWIECADQALYQAKNSGRNKTCIYKYKQEH